MFGFSCAFLINARCISKPVLSLWCNILYSECPPSRASEYFPVLSLSNCAPHSINSSIRSVDSRIVKETIFLLFKPAPASMVSIICFS